MSETSGDLGRAQRPWSIADHYRLMACREYILRALKDAMGERPQRIDWVEHEREAVAVAATTWAQTHGLDSGVSVEDVERIEQRAVGHFDYASKLALHVAEFVTAGAA